MTEAGTRGSGGCSINKMLAMQEQGPRFDPPEPILKVLDMVKPTAAKADTGGSLGLTFQPALPSW